MGWGRGEELGFQTHLAHTRILGCMFRLNNKGTRAPQEQGSGKKGWARCRPEGTDKPSAPVPLPPGSEVFPERAPVIEKSRRSRKGGGEGEAGTGRGAAARPVHGGLPRATGRRHKPQGPVPPPSPHPQPHPGMQEGAASQLLHPRRLRSRLPVLPDPDGGRTHRGVDDKKERGLVRRIKCPLLQGPVRGRRGRGTAPAS